MTQTPARRDLYAQRRLHLAQQLGPGGIALVPTAASYARNRDSEFPYRHDSYFYYLCGFTEPDAWLLITAEGESTLLCQPKDLEREIWDGYRLGPDAAPTALGVHHAASSQDLEQRLPRLLENRQTVWYPFATHAGLPQRIDSWLSKVRSRVRFGVQCPSQQRDLCGLLDEMRLVKDDHELGLMRRAARISADAHVRAMHDATVSVFEGGRELGCDDDGAALSESRFTFVAQRGRRYTLVVDGYRGARGPYELSVSRVR